MRIIAIGVVLTLMTAAAAVAVAGSDRGLQRLKGIDASFRGYKTANPGDSFPIECLSVRMGAEVGRFARITEGWIRTRALPGAEKETARSLFRRHFRKALSSDVEIRDRCPFQLIVSCYGGGVLVDLRKNAIGMIRSELFLVNTVDRSLIYHSEKIFGKGADVETALRDLSDGLKEHVVKLVQDGREPDRKAKVDRSSH